MKGYSKKQVLITISVFVIIIIVPLLLYYGYKARKEYLLQKNLEEHFGNTSLSDKEIEDLAQEIVSPTTEYSDETPSSDELEILQNPDFKQCLAEAMSEICPDDIIDISVTIEESSWGDLLVTAHVKTDLRNLNISMSKLFNTDSWIYYLIMDADSGHVYYAPDSAKEYANIYDYFTDELISTPETGE